MNVSTKRRPNSIAIVGVGLGDEGKGRIVDDTIGSLVKKKNINKVYVVRFQGGSNSGHTIEFKGKRIALHQVPSGIFYSQVTGFIDRGMVIHPEDLSVEIGYVEKIIGDTRGKLYLSEEAILVTDLERAEELLNRKKQGKASGGTGRGIGPSYAHHYDRLGLHIHDLMHTAWKEVLGAHYDRYTKEFEAFGESIADIQVPDFEQSKKLNKPVLKAIGSKKHFLERMGETRSWLQRRKIVTNLYPLHHEIYSNMRAAVVFEGAQALALHPWLGTIPDTTASNTSAFGIQEGTGYWLLSMLEEVIGVFKLTYTSSVGARRMPTQIYIPKEKELPLSNPTEDQEWATYVIEKAHEYGTTTKRRRDILHLDLPMLLYNCKMSGITSLAGTHLDIARPNTNIKVCIGYKDKKGNTVLYQPGLRYLEGVVPVYKELAGWGGETVSSIKEAKQFPKQALQYLTFIEKYLGLPFSLVTTGPARDQLVTMR